MRISMKKLEEFGAAFLIKRGVPEGNARHVSKVVVETEAFLQSTHGLAQFTALAAALGKTIDPEGEPEIVRGKGAVVLIDGSRCMGNLAVKLAKKEAAEMARAQGIGFVAVRNTHWIGALGPHLISIAEEGLLCQVWAQSSTCKDCAPFGGVDACFSTNPIALAFPGDGHPVVADFSTATMSMSAATALKKKGARTATPRFLDRAGEPSDDPSVLDRGGSMMFMGGDEEGHKGYALALFNEALTVLAGGSANNPDTDLYQSFSLMVLDPEAFAGADYYAKEMRRFLAHVKSSRARPGFGAVRLPGERGFQALEECRVRGVPLDGEKCSMLRKLATDHELDFEELGTIPASGNRVDPVVLRGGGGDG